MECYGRVAGIEGAAGFLADDLGVERVGYLDGDSVIDGPQGADDVRVSGDLERRGEVDGFIDELDMRRQCRITGRQVSQAGMIQADGGERGDGQGGIAVVVQEQATPGGIGRIVGAMAGEMGCRAGCQTSEDVGPVGGGGIRVVGSARRAAVVGGVRFCKRDGAR